MSIKQISIFLVNKPGTLKNMTGVLAANHIDMRAISLAETKEYGIARIVVDDVIRAVDILKEADFVTSVNSVIALEIPDEPGALDALLETFASVNVNIEYMYSFIIGHERRSAGMIFRVNDTAAAENKLTARGIQVLSLEDIQ
ncbi:MAG: acetolactate synthase [Erysipelotrichaceae bacterium]|nr:acetolactate synthase [Erysipelotrichaceae bacterium]